jgi:hypothetical protein
MGAVLPVRPKVDALGISWRRRERWWYAGVFGEHQYTATFGEPRPGQWTILFSDGFRPFVELTGERDAIVRSLSLWLEAEGLEVPA